MTNHSSTLNASTRYISDEPTLNPIFRAGLIGGLLGGAVMLIYETLVWMVGRSFLPLSTIPPNPVGLLFGRGFQEGIGGWAFPLGAAIHFAFAIIWGVVFAAIWPYFRRRGYEATLVALFYAVIGWIVVHVAITIVTGDHPNYQNPAVIIGGLMSYFFYAVPMAWMVRALLAPGAGGR